MDKIRWPFIVPRHDDDPPVVSRVVFASIAHIGFGDVTGGSDPLSQESTLIRRKRARWKLTNGVTHLVRAFSTRGYDRGGHDRKSASVIASAALMWINGQADPAPMDIVRLHPISEMTGGSAMGNSTVGLGVMPM